jgi:tRNA nucleotidyltransferase/poly(A) polymerase
MIKDIFRALTQDHPGVKIYRVGGAVRDDLLPNKPPTMDQDYLITGAPFEILISYLLKYGKVEHVGATFGVLKFYERGSKNAIDIALPRKEISTGPGHKDFKVEFDHTISVKDDLKRRDFTINAIAFDIFSKKYIDPFNGRKSIIDKIVKVVNSKAFTEDPLRILRGAQFAARFNFVIEPTTLKLMQQNTFLLQYVSIERVTGELNKLLSSPKPSIGLKYLDEIGALKHLLPDLISAKTIIQTRKGKASSVYDHIMLAVDAAPQDHLEIRWAALLHDLAKPACHKTVEGRDRFIGHDTMGSRNAKKTLIRFKFPTVFINKVTHLIRHHMFDAPPSLTPKAVRRLIKKVGPEHIFDLLALRRADRKGTTEKISMWKIDNLEEKIRTELADKPFSINDLKIDGHAVMNHTGLKPGPEIGLILNILLYYVLYKDVKNDANTLISHIPYPVEGAKEYCPHGTRHRLSTIIEFLSSEKPYSWTCASDCGGICENKY